MAKFKRKKTWSNREGVSEIVGTILILAITVVLFASIMAFVINMPVPTNKPIADFSATLTVKGDAATLTLLHNGGQNLYAYTTDIFISNGTSSRQHFTLANGGIISPTSNPTWMIGQFWSADINSKFGVGSNKITNSTQIEVNVIDIDTNSMIWASMVGTGGGNNVPVVLQRWVDADNATLTPDPLKETTTKSWSFYVRATDSDDDLPATGVWVDASSIDNSSTMAGTMANDVWEFVFSPPTNATKLDGKPLVIHAKDNAGHTSNETYILNVLQAEPGQVGPAGTPGAQGPKGEPGGSGGGNEFGLPDWLKFINNGQGWVVLGENTSARPPWGHEANTDDAKNIFIQGDEWIFIRVGSLYMTDIQRMNNLTVISRTSGAIITPPSSHSGFNRLDEAGNAFIYEAKFNSSILMPGGYDVIVELQSSSTIESPDPFYAKINLNILPRIGTIYIPETIMFEKNRRAETATEWGTLENPYDLSNSSLSILWLEVKMQTAKETAPRSTTPSEHPSISEIRIENLRGTVNLYGKPPSGTGMISSIFADQTNATYYVKVDLRLLNGGTWSPGKNAYSLTISNLLDDNEGIYTVSCPIWITASQIVETFLVGCNGMGVGNNNFAHDEYFWQIDNNKFFTQRILDQRDETPGGGGGHVPSMKVYRVLYFDIDGDGDRDALAAVSDNGAYRLGIYINRINEYGIWEPRNNFANYTDSANQILSLAYGDINGDGAYDWVVAESTGKVVAYLNSFPIVTKILFDGSAVATKYFFQAMKLIDINNDGLTELVGLGNSGAIVDRGGATSKIWMFNLTYPNGTIRPMNNMYQFLRVPALANVWDFAMGDIDKDGHPDLAVTMGPAAGGSSSVKWYKWSQTLGAAANATADIGGTGTRILNDYTATNAGGGSYEVLEEAGGSLSWVWPLGKVYGSTPVLTVIANVTSTCNENFYFYYSRDASGPYTMMFVLPSTCKSFSTMTFPLPSTVIGSNIWVKVEDAGMGGASNYKVCIDRIDAIGVDRISYLDIIHSFTTDSGATPYVAIGIGEFDGSGYRDIAVGKTSTIKVLKGGADDAVLSTISNPTINSYLCKILPSGYSSINDLAEMFKIADVNGDGLSDIVAVTSNAAAPDVTMPIDVVEWLNVGGTSFSVIEVKNYYTYFAGATGAEFFPIRAIAVENMYG